MSKEQKRGFLEHYYRGLSTEDLVVLYRQGHATDLATEAILEVFRERDISMHDMEIVTSFEVEIEREVRPPSF